MNMRHGNVRTTVLLFLVLLYGVWCVDAASGNSGSSLESRPEYFAFQQHVLNYRQAIQALKRLDSLRRQGLVSESEYQENQLDYERKKLEVQHSLVELIRIQPDIQILSCEKTRSLNDVSTLDVTLQDRTRFFPSVPGLAEEEMKDIMGSRRPAGRTANEWKVSLCNESGTIIGNPYIARVNTNAETQIQKVHFRMLENVDSVILKVQAGEWSQDFRIRPVIAETGDQLAVRAERFAQEASLGGEIRYTLHLETFANTGSAYGYAVSGLPAEIQCRLEDCSTKTTVSKIGFSGAARSVDLQLCLSLPNLPGSIPLDRTIPFRIGFLEEQTRGQAHPQEKGGVSLEILVRAASRFRVFAGNLMRSTAGEKPVRLSFTFQNTGQKTIFRPSTEIEAPPEWQTSLGNMPASLDPGQSREVEVVLTPPPSLANGDYTVRIHPFCFDGDRKVAGDELLFRIEHSPDQGSGLRIGLIGMIAVLVGAFLFAAVRYSKK